MSLKELLARLGPLGIIGQARLREALDGDLMQLRDRLRGKLTELLKTQGQEDPWVWVVAMFEDAVVVEDERAGELKRYPFTVGEDDSIAFGDPVAVKAQYVPASKDEPTPEGASSFVEAQGPDDDGCRFEIRVIREGLSGNGNLYPAAVLREAVSLFDGVPVYVKSDEEHLAGKGRDVRNIVGQLTAPRFVEGQAGGPGEIRATFELLEPEGTIATKLREAWKRKMSGLFNFSIDAAGTAKRQRIGGKLATVANSITKVDSVDLIAVPGAGGSIVTFIEAAGEPSEDDDMFRKKFIEALQKHRPDLLQGRDVDAMSDDELETLFTEAMGGQAAGTRQDGGGNSGVTLDDVQQMVRMVEARAEARAMIDASSLPDPAKVRLREAFDGKDSFTRKDVESAIKGEAEYVAKFTEAGSIRGLGGERIEAGQALADKVPQMLDDFFTGTRLVSFKEAYIQMTGDTRVTGRLRDCDPVRLREALGTGDLGDVLGDAINRAMIADYRQPNVLDSWRKVCTIDRANDFRTQERARIGGYGDLPDVAEGADYTYLVSPGDEKSTYAVGKKGGLETLTIEAIKNDDVGLIRRIPLRLSRSAKRTLSRFVFSWIVDNPVIYDGVALFHASHNNLFTAAFAEASYESMRLALWNQTPFGEAEPLAVPVRNLLVPAGLEKTASDTFVRDTNNDPTFHQRLAPEIIPVWTMTDANDWAVTADPIDVPGIQIGFLDGNEEPEIWVQDSPTGGSMFSSDKLTWKIRHIYGGHCMDFRFACKAVVAD